jgi:hypothetical protein
MKQASWQVRQFVKDSGISLKEFKSLTGLSSSQVMRWFSGEDHLLKQKHVSNLEAGLCTTLEGLRSKKILNKCFYENFRGERIAVSEQYVEEARSYVRSSSHVVKYLELLFGKERIRCILKEMSVHRAYFDELDNKINILFFVDLLEKCRRLGLSKKELRMVAGAMFLSIEGTESEKLFKKCNSHTEAYLNIKEIVNKFDTNFYYDFNVGEKEVVMFSEPHESVVSLLEKRCLDYLFYYRLQIFGSVIKLCGVSDIELELDKKCSATDYTQIYRGNFPILSSSRHLELL